MSKALLRLLRWSAIFALCDASSKAVISKSVPYLNVVVDNVLSKRLKEEGTTEMDHTKQLIEKVNELLGQLVPPGSINLTKLVVNTAENDSAYFTLWNDGKVKSETTLKKFVAYINKHTQLGNADFVTLLTGRRMTKDRDPKQAVEGIKWGRGVCGSMTGALVSDTGDTNRTVLTFTHELSHALGANHDGEKTAKSCKDVGRSIMNRNFRGIGTSYSFCSMKDINAFLKRDQAKCMFEEPPRAPVVDPEVEKRRKRECDKSKAENEYYYIRQGGNFCKYSCLFVNSTSGAATREIWVTEKDGTPCNASNPKQECKDGVCEQVEKPISEDKVEY
ncbi:zinc metalloproteinase-disintegrin-like batroxstatin-3 isoform X2 [Rhipicephalus microplus]|uniref:zinc metalloproteinase-disintegrin-like batroxstatin-3 isoform X2 n=1 Tax=Rhipicephalus microplus TaxID=6941 RepID=UPI003F6D6C21